MRVLAIGECLAELAPTDNDGGLRMRFAGDTFNTVWYLNKVAPDTQVSYLSAVGDDAISQKMKAFIGQSGVDNKFVQVAAGKTIGLYMITLDRGERSFSYWRGQSAAKTLADDPALLDEAMADMDVIYFSGITLAILSAEGRKNLFTALSKARAAGKVISFDPNLRQRLWASDQEMTQTIMQGAAVCDIVLPSFEDEANWFNDANIQATADRYHGVGVKTVIVKNGAEAILLAQDGTYTEIPVHPVENLVDSTAAGDAFNAGFFAGYAAGYSLIERVKYGCALSRTVVQQLGALVEIDPSNLFKPDLH